MDKLQIKEAVRARDKHRCVCCGRIDSGNCDKLHDVHRIYPGFPYCVESCVTLCRRCHAYMPNKIEQLIASTYKGVYGLMIARTSPESEELINGIWKLVKEYDDKHNSDGVVFFGINRRESKTVYS